MKCRDCFYYHEKDSECDKMCDVLEECVHPDWDCINPMERKKCIEDGMPRYSPDEGGQ